MSDDGIVRLEKMPRMDIGLWPKLEFDCIGDQLKEQENSLRGTRYVDHDVDFIIRVDGRAFHTFTRTIEKPFSAPFRAAMQAGAEAVVSTMKCQFAYHQSDEISYVFKGARSRNQSTYEHPFGGRVDKLLSTIASLTSVAFYKAACEHGLVSTGMLPHFDARLACVGFGFTPIMKAVAWRENDAMRNAVAMVAQSMFSQKALHGKNIADQVRMIDSLPHHAEGYVNLYAAANRRGTYIRTIKEHRELTDSELEQIPAAFRPDPGTTFIRSVMQEFFFDSWDEEERLVLWT